MPPHGYKSDLPKRAIILGGGTKERCIDLGWTRKYDIEIWGINFLHRDTYPFDRMFHIHRYELLKKYGYPTYRDAMWAKDHPEVSIFLADEWPDKRMAHAQIFPANELRTKYPRGDYHCNSCDWLIAYALHEGFSEITLHGFRLELEGAAEQNSAAKCAEYWAGFAEGKGMRVHVAEDSAMFGVYHLALSNRVYGYDDCPFYEDRRPGAKDPPYRYDDY